MLSRLRIVRALPKMVPSPGPYAWDRRPVAPKGDFGPRTCAGAPGSGRNSRGEPRGARKPGPWSP